MAAGATFTNPANDPSTECPRKSDCYQRYISNTGLDSEVPICVRKGHGPASATVALAAQTHMNWHNSLDPDAKLKPGRQPAPPHPGTKPPSRNFKRWWLTVATIALLGPRAAGVLVYPPPASASQPPTATPPDVFWSRSVAAAIERHHVAAAAATDAASLVIAPMRSGTSTFNALIDGGATASCIASSLAARLASEGRLALTGRSISISSVAV